MTRLGLYIVHNNSERLVQTVDVPWDFPLNAPDGSIEPNPLPPSELIEPEDFIINDLAAERMILYIRQEQSREPYKPIILDQATFIVPYILAEKLGVITKVVEDDDVTRLASFLKNYPDLKTELYLTNESISDEYLIKIRGEKGTRLFLFEEDNLPNFADSGSENPIEPDEPDIGEPDEGESEDAKIMPLSDGNGEDESPSIPPEELPPEEEPIIVITDILDAILEIYSFDNKIVLIPSDLAVSAGILQKDLDENMDFLDIEYENTKFIFFKDLSDIPAEEGMVRLVIDTIPEPPHYTSEELFINWFKDYFYSTLVKQEDFIKNLNNNRTYVIISQENENIMGLLTLHKGSADLDFDNHNYANLIDAKFPNIREDMIIHDNLFGGYDDDKDFTQNKPSKPKHECHPGCIYHDNNFGGYDDDPSFSI